ncbi:MAG TPA: hypothetical protein VN922_13030 [Bacteroidia bacterium]|nr:hypothetical protein [Bacteroidia bacterium]
MGLFDTVRDEVAELFEEWVNIPVESALGKKIAIAMCNDMRQSGNFRSERVWNSNRDGLLTLEDGTLVITKSRFEAFYKKAGQIITAYDLLKTGQYSAREVSKICQMSINTVCKLLKKDKSLKCICGKPLREHRGWCKHRVGKSIARQEFLINFGRQPKERFPIFI